jgi:hypothetical protein
MKLKIVFIFGKECWFVKQKTKGAVSVRKNSPGFTFKDPTPISGDR